LISKISADQFPSATTGSAIDPYLRLLTKEELAPFIGKAPRSIDRMVRLREIPYLKIGRHVRFRLRDVEQALDRFIVKAAAEPSKQEASRA
jgi:excisionase family DNA binding protein